MLTDRFDKAHPDLLAARDRLDSSWKTSWSRRVRQESCVPT
jgi:hypothetical protein